MAAVVPVPLHRWRIWRRGSTNRPCWPGEIARQRSLTLAVDALTRRKPTPALGVGRNAARGAVPLSGAIAVNRGRIALTLAGAQIVLVDDVMTSGRDLRRLRRALKRAGGGARS